MNDLLKLWEQPDADETYMIVGWEQWADAGSVSSELPQYLISLTGARKIGEIRPDGFYLFQVPGTHDLLRPKIKLREGYREELEPRKNEFYYVGDERKGLVIFLGEEPHLHADRYAETIFDAAETLAVRRIIVLGGVYGAMPYEKDREISCVYSLPRLKPELDKYALKYSDYQGGTTIGAYLAHRAERRNIELIVLYAFVPSYDFAQPALSVQGIRIENDFKAWHDVMKRINHMLGLGLDLSDLQRQSDELISTMDSQLAELEEEMPQLHVSEYMEGIRQGFTELSFIPLDDVWERGLRDIFDDES